VVSPDNQFRFVEGGAGTMDCHAIASNSALNQAVTMVKVPMTSEEVAIG
jgi:hypothetical protein